MVLCQRRVVGVGGHGGSRISHGNTKSTSHSRTSPRLEQGTYRRPETTAESKTRHRDLVLGRLRDGTGDIPGVLMFFAGDLASISFRTALGLGRTCLAGVLQRLVFGDALSCRPAVGVGVVPAELSQSLTFGADVLVVLGIPFKIRAGPGTIRAACFIDDRDVRCNITIH